MEVSFQSRMTWTSARFGLGSAWRVILDAIFCRVVGLYCLQPVFDLLPANILPHLDLVANFRLHGDIPNTLETIHQDIDIGTPRLIEKSGKIIHHVTVTYTPGNLEMYRLQEVVVYPSAALHVAF